MFKRIQIFIFFVAAVFLVETNITQAQEDDDINIQNYTPSVLLKKGQWEYKFFNNLYTQTKGFGANGEKIDFNSRGNYFTNLHQLLIGAGTKINAGADLWLKGAEVCPDDCSPFGVLQLQNNTMQRVGLAYAGPKIKIAPFSYLEKLSFQSTFLVPLGKDLDGSESGEIFLSQDAYIWINQLFYDQKLGEKFQLFAQLSAWVYLDKAFDADKHQVSSPTSVFLSWFPTERLTFYMQNEVWPTYGSDEFIPSWFFQAGLGGKVQIIPGRLEAEVLYTNFLVGKNAGAGETYNLGIRLIR